MAHGRAGSVHAYICLEVPRIAAVAILCDLTGNLDQGLDEIATTDSPASR